MTTPDPAGLEPLRGPKTPRSQKHGLKSQKHPPQIYDSIDCLFDIICLDSASNMSAKAEPTPAGTQLS